jgi:hypothetical protein
LVEGGGAGAGHDQPVGHGRQDVEGAAEDDAGTSTPSGDR